VHAGEILGVAGVDGNGQRELVEAIVGLRSSASGQISLRGRDITAEPVRQTIEAGVSHVPEDRHRRGLVLEMDLAENLVLGDHRSAPYSTWGILHPAAITSMARDRIAEFDVRAPSERALAGNLSGGNQQKLVLARELGRDPDLLIAAQPTRGLDVGAIEFVHRQILAARDDGKAVLLVSLELDEVLSLADRILVIYEGRIVREFAPSDATAELVGLYMTGGGVPEQPMPEGEQREGVIQ
jgi:simple sugar transport system ATP-binding protein